MHQLGPRVSERFGAQRRHHAGVVGHVVVPLVDRLFYAMLNGLMGTKWVVESAFAKQADRFVSVMQTGFRILLFAVALFAVAVAWEVAGVSLLQSDTGRHVLMAVIDIGITLLFAYVLFEVVVAILTRRCRRPTRKMQRCQTVKAAAPGQPVLLAPLIRSTFVLLVVIVLLTVLSSLGLEVAPLLAGAGVFGIAIGFGAQKLVQDVISGLFFLVDDAFRRVNTSMWGQSRVRSRRFPSARCNCAITWAICIRFRLGRFVI